VKHHLIAAGKYLAKNRGWARERFERNDARTWRPSSDRQSKLASIGADIDYRRQIAIENVSMFSTRKDTIIQERPS
jgi:hypothetical protein